MRLETRASEHPVRPPSVQAKKEMSVSSSTANLSMLGGCDDVVDGDKGEEAACASVSADLYIRSPKSDQD